MTSHIVLYNRPIGLDTSSPVLTLTGVLPDYRVASAYSGELSIGGSVGRCTVEVLSANMPPGYSVRVDNIRKKVIVSWPKFSIVEDAQSHVPNGGFENGDDGTWTLGNGWSIAKNDPYNVETGLWSAKFADINTKGSSMYSTRVAAKVNDLITFNARVQQGASSKGNAGARCLLIFRDAAGAEIGNQSGGMVSSGSGGEWKNSGTTAAAPSNTATVEVHVAAYRNKENKPLFVDNVTWSHKYVVGSEEDAVYFVSLRITDAENRTANWSGNIDSIKAPPRRWQVYVPTHGSAQAKMYGFSDKGFDVDLTIDMDDGYTRTHGYALPNGHTEIMSGGVIPIRTSLDYGRIYKNWTGTAHTANQCAYLGDVLFHALGSDSAYYTSTDQGVTPTYYPGETARAFLTAGSFVIRFPYQQSRTAELNSSMPPDWGYSGVTSEESRIICGATDYANNRGAWGYSGQVGATRTIMIQSRSSVARRVVPVDVDLLCIGRCEDSWLAAFGTAGLWRITDAGQTIKVIDANVVSVACNGEAAGAVVGGKLRYSRDSGVSWEEVNVTVPSGDMSFIMPDLKPIIQE